MEKKAFVLLSGGLDSTTCLYKAIEECKPGPEVIGDWKIQDGVTTGIDWVEAISIDYGQRHIKEAEYAAQTCLRLGIKHSILKIGDILSGEGVMLTDASVHVPNITYDDIKGVSPTYVPFRNGTMLSIITAYAQKWVNLQIAELQYAFERTGTPGDAGARATEAAKDVAHIYFGAHAEDAHNWAYPDCTPEFVGAMANAIYIGSYFSIRLHTPFIFSSKAEIVAAGTKLGVPYENTWSCYKGEFLQCGECPTCYARKAAFEDAGVEDPTVYASDEEDEAELIRRQKSEGGVN